MTLSTCTCAQHIFKLVSNLSYYEIFLRYVCVTVSSIIFLAIVHNLLLFVAGKPVNVPGHPDYQPHLRLESGPEDNEDGVAKMKRFQRTLKRKIAAQHSPRAGKCKKVVVMREPFAGER